MYEIYSKNTQGFFSRGIIFGGTLSLDPTITGQGQKLRGLKSHQNIRSGRPLILVVSYQGVNTMHHSQHTISLAKYALITVLRTKYEVST